MRKIRVAVLYGGRSAEHDVSVQSARTVVQNLDLRRYAVKLLCIDREGRWRAHGALTGPQQARSALPAPASVARELAFVPGRGLGKAAAVDVVFSVLHGPNGEDGSVQGLLQLAGVPYVGAGILGSALGMDKEVSKRLSQGAGLRVAPHVLVRRGEALAPALRSARRLGLPIFVKPACLGSSVGVRKIARWSQLPDAVRYALRFDDKVLVEKGIEGMEIAVGVLGSARRARASVCGAVQVRGKHKFFSYEAKYLDPEGFSFVIPAPVPAARAREIRRQAVRAFQALEAEGMARVDFMVDRRGGVFFGEINTIPGFTSHSLYPKLWEASGLPLPKLLDTLIRLALRKKRR